MNHSQLDQLIIMANQIADNNHLDTEAESIEFIATHIKKFWARSMKEELITYAKEGGDKLNVLATQAIMVLSEQYTSRST
ncbi:formate dehydrogenase subunit delta [Neptunomonas japonica]|uniref:formate dehydrogenase subunit delta n=1 Tax=Neptunomonas japonica TaxID=417574 RepID=UPI00041E78BD|nr:formate dehydrogenase subunit delta [Neptunomonas japonica]